MADALVSGASEHPSCGFKSHPPHQKAPEAGSLFCKKRGWDLKPKRARGGKETVRWTVGAERASSYAAKPAPWGNPQGASHPPHQKAPEAGVFFSKEDGT